MFHRFRLGNSESLLQGALSADEFETILLREGVKNFLSPADWIEHSIKGTLQPNHRCITFDDGLKSQIEVALPVLQRLGLTAFWFVYTCVWQGIPVKSEVYSFAAAKLGGMDLLIKNFFARCPDSFVQQLEDDNFTQYKNSIRNAVPFYTDNDIRYRYIRNHAGNRLLFEETMDKLLEDFECPVQQMASSLWFEPLQAANLALQGHHVGLHSHAHPYDISQLNLAEQKSQYQMNYDLILNATKNKPLAVAHPLNSYSEDTLDILRSMGIMCGFRSNISAPSGKKVNPGPLEWAREDSANLNSPNASMSV